MESSESLAAFIVIFYAIAVFFGASIGSFAAATYERVKAGRSLMVPSACACGRPLKPSENIPIVGWLKARGVAKCCGARIPIWYWLVEVVFAVVGAAVCWALLPG